MRKAILTVLITTATIHSTLPEDLPVMANPGLSFASGLVAFTSGITAGVCQHYYQEKQEDCRLTPDTFKDHKALRRLKTAVVTASILSVLSTGLCLTSLGMYLSHRIKHPARPAVTLPFMMVPAPVEQPTSPAASLPVPPVPPLNTNALKRQQSRGSENGSSATMSPPPQPEPPLGSDPLSSQWTTYLRSLAQWYDVTGCEEMANSCRRMANEREGNISELARGKEVLTGLEESIPRTPSGLFDLETISANDLRTDTTVSTPRTPLSTPGTADSQFTWAISPSPAGTGLRQKLWYLSPSTTPRSPWQSPRST